MMDEYILYYRGKIVGGIYDDRLLVKPIKPAVSYMPEAVYELPYEGTKNFWQDYFMRCMMNCRRRKRKNRFI